LEDGQVSHNWEFFMATITFTLRNNQMTDVNVNVVDLRTNRLVVENQPLNRDETVTVEVFADSSGRGAAAWTFRSGDGSVNSNKTQSDISDGDECTLG
jgi:hypothetical protein